MPIYGKLATHHYASTAEINKLVKNVLRRRNLTASNGKNQEEYLAQGIN